MGALVEAMPQYKGRSSFPSSKYLGSSKSHHTERLRKIALFLVICAFLYASYIMLLDQILLLSLTGVTASALLPEKQPCSSSTNDVPQYFQTTPELWAGPTATGRAPFLVSKRKGSTRLALGLWEIYMNSKLIYCLI